MNPPQQQQLIHNPFHRGVIALGLGLSLIGFLTFAEEASKNATPPQPQTSSLQSPYTNSPPSSVFHEMEGRDPFVPVGYKKPKPMDLSQDVKVEISLSGISSSSDGSPVAITKDGLYLEIGGTYTYRTKDGKGVVSYKVTNITEDGVTISYSDKEEVIRTESSDLEKFQEKEE
jgi:hypothetical protein